MFYRIKQLFYNYINNIVIHKDSSEEVKVIYIHRYLSWTLTSAVYLAGKPYSIILFKLGVVVSLLICSKLLTDLYIKFMNNKGMLRTLVLIETMGTTLLLLPTGGLSSPFIWYALNPTLVAASYLAPWFCWMNLLFYILTGTTMSYFLFNISQSNILTIFTSNSNLILVFILITLAVQLLANLTKKLHIQKTALQVSNKQKQESIEHIMSLYEIIEAFNSHSIREKLFEELAKYTAKLTQSNLCFFWLPNIRNMNNDGGILKANIHWDETEQQNMITDIKELSIDIQHAKEIIEIQISGAYYEAVPILSPASYYGIIAISKRNNIKPDYKEQKYQLLNFISKLSAVTLERFYLEDIGDNLLLMEEQNRIANEIHDSVSQRLFSICYVIHGILGRWENMSKDQLKEYFTEMNHSANMAMQELRDSIYKLSSRKKGEKSLEVTLKAFLDNISKLNDIIIDFKIQGDEGLLPLALKKGITRIIREACGNAIRHGKCDSISVNLQINKDQINLNITDDGKGFLAKSEALEEQKGLGISNMKSLTSLFHGIMKIESTLGNGTRIQIDIPLNKEFDNILQGGLAI
jgi:NarL family two-component system sensor histidine kinase LiaS